MEAALRDNSGEPGRDTLARIGAADCEEPTGGFGAAFAGPETPRGARRCSQCKTPDRAIFQPASEPLHFVVPEIRYLRRGEAFEPRMTHYGWHPRTFQGKPAMERMICRDCLNVNELRDRVWGQLKDAAKKLEPGPDDSHAEFYRVLCE